MVKNLIQRCPNGQGCGSLLNIGGDNLQFYPNFALFSTVGVMNLDHEFVQVSKLSEEQKKKVFTKNGTLFFPNSSGDLRSNADQSQIFGGDADVHHTQIKLLGGIQSNYWGIYPPPPPPPPPPGFRHPC